MQTRITSDEMHAAARQLAKTENGRTAMQRLLDLAEDDELALGLLDQHAFLALLGGVWTGQKETACEAMREILADKSSI
jgi:hypothetical protein